MIMSSYDINSSKMLNKEKNLQEIMTITSYEIGSLTGLIVYYTAARYLPDELLLKRPTSALSLSLPFVSFRLLQL